MIALKAVRSLKGRDVKAAGAGLSGGEEEGGGGGGGKGGGGPIFLGGFCLGWGGTGGGNGWAGFWEWPCWAFFLLSSWSCCNGVIGDRLEAAAAEGIS